MTHTFSSFTPAPSMCFAASLGLCQREGAELLAMGPHHLPCLLRLAGSSSVNAQGLNGIVSKGSVSPESHASEIRAKKGSGAVTIERGLMENFLPAWHCPQLVCAA